MSNKNYERVLLVLLFFSSAIHSIGQYLAPPPEGKAVVYIVRPSGLGIAANFTFFDSVRAIGKFNGVKYMRYECEPGHHLIWARSENKEFIEADVEAGKIYFIEAVPKMGAIKAAVRLEPIYTHEIKRMSKALKMMAKSPPQSYTQRELDAITQSYADVIQRGMVKYREDKGNGVKIDQLAKDKFIEFSRGN